MAEKFKGKYKGLKVIVPVAVVLIVLAVFVFGINKWSIDVVLNGDRKVTIECGEEFEDEGAQAYFHGSLIFKKGWPVEISEVTELDVSEIGQQNIFYYAEAFGKKSWTKRCVYIVDTTAPDIVLNEIEGFYTLPDHVYEEEGFTATDNYDGDVTERVECEEKNGFVYYIVTDSCGNTAKAVREIFYDDPIAPEITLDGDAEIILEAGTAYEDPGYSAMDNVDGDMTDFVQVTGEVDETKLGTYTLTYSVIDGYDNVTTVERIITIVDTTAPELKLKGDKKITLNIGTAYEEAGYTVKDNCDGDLKDAVQVEGTVDVKKLGTYKLTYTVADSSGNSSTVERTVVVEDTEAPKISLKGDSKITLTLGTAFKDAGYTASDNYDGDVTSSVKVSGSVNKDKVGKYTITYSVTDSNGNKTSVKRTVAYIEKTPPVITLKGDAKITINAGTKYSEPGYTASDNYDGDLTSSVKVSGKVNSYSAGTYTLTYTVTDSSGNKASAKRTVVVKAVQQSNPGTVTPNGKVIYLTFDDGPGKYTQKLLDVLAKYNVKATFFTVSNSYAYMMAKEAAAGHTVAIHSATHDFSEIYSSEDAYFADLYKQQDLIYQQTGIKTTLVRFPGGSSNSVSKKYNTGIMTRLANSLTSMGYTYFDWNVDSNDAGGASSADEVFQNVISGVQKRKVSIVLQHDIKGFSVDAVERIIVWGLENGYTFLPLDASSPTAHHTIKN